MDIICKTCDVDDDSPCKPQFEDHVGHASTLYKHGQKPTVCLCPFSKNTKHAHTLSKETPGR